MGLHHTPLVGADDGPVLLIDSYGHISQRLAQLL
jgi:hypothetical protein